MKDGGRIYTHPKMKVTIDISQEDIDKGERSDACLCPVALGALRTKAFTHVAVGGHTMSVQLPTGEVIKVHLPWEVQERIMRLDVTGFMNPFSFELDLTEPNRCTTTRAI